MASDKRWRHQARVLAVQALYQVELAGVPPAQAVRTAARLANPDGRDEEPDSRPPSDPSTTPEVEYAETLARLAWGRRAEVDALIGGTSTHWKVSRLGRIETEVLRVATAEMLQSPEIPVAVVIDEAIELARSFAGDEAARFVNGVVDAIAKALAAQGRIKRPAGGKSPLGVALAAPVSGVAGSGSAGPGRDADSMAGADAIVAGDRGVEVRLPAAATTGPGEGASVTDGSGKHTVDRGSIPVSNRAGGISGRVSASSRPDAAPMLRDATSSRCSRIRAATCTSATARTTSSATA